MECVCFAGEKDINGKNCRERTMRNKLKSGNKRGANEQESCYVIEDGEWGSEDIQYRNQVKG